MGLVRLKGLFKALDGFVDDFDVSPPQEVYAVCEAVVTGVNDAADACLDDELGTFDAGRVGDVERGTFRVVARTGNLGDGVGFGMKHVWLRHAVVVFADIFEAGRRAVVAVADNHLILHDECAHLPSGAIAVFAPNACHAQVAQVEFTV